MTLFSLPEPDPLPRPKAAAKGQGPVAYADYKSVTGRCDDCATVAYEWLMQGKLNAPPIRKAHYKRTQGTLATLLCAEHKRGRTTEEAKAAS